MGRASSLVPKNINPLNTFVHPLYHALTNQCGGRRTRAGVRSEGSEKTITQWLASHAVVYMTKDLKLEKNSPKIQPVAHKNGHWDENLFLLFWEFKKIPLMVLTVFSVSRSVTSGFRPLIYYSISHFLKDFK